LTLLCAYAGVPAYNILTLFYLRSFWVRDGPVFLTTPPLFPCWRYRSTYFIPLHAGAFPYSSAAHLLFLLYNNVFRFYRATPQAAHTSPAEGRGPYYRRALPRSGCLGDCAIRMGRNPHRHRPFPPASYLHALTCDSSARFRWTLPTPLAHTARAAYPVLSEGNSWRFAGQPHHTYTMAAPRSAAFRLVFCARPLPFGGF